MSNRDGNRSRPSGGLSRRDALRRLGLYGAGALAAPGILAACGDDDDDDAGGTATTAGGAATTAAGAATTAGGAATTAGGAATTAGGSAPAAGDVGAELAELLQIDASADNAEGVDFQLGAVLALTGNGSYYGTTMTNGIDLAVRHVAAAGGPNIDVTYKDHKSGDAQAATQAMTEIGTAGIPAKLASYADGLGAMLAGTAQYKCFTLDGGGGTSIFAQGQPYFWGTRAITPERRPARPVRVRQADLARRQDHRPHRLGHRRAEHPDRRGRRDQEDRRRRLRVQRPVGAVPAEHDRLRRDADQDPGQRAGRPAVLLLRAGPRIPARPVTDGRTERADVRVRVHPGRGQRLQRRVRQRRLDVRLRLLRRRATRSARSPSSSCASSRPRTAAQTPTSTRRTSTRTCSCCGR